MSSPSASPPPSLSLPLPLYSVWSLDILQIEDPLYGLPSPCLLLPLATSTAAVAGVKKVGVCSNSRCERNVCVCSVSLHKVCVVVTGCHWYHGMSSVCVCVYVCKCVFSLAEAFGGDASKKPPPAPMLLPHWLDDWPCVCVCFFVQVCVFFSWTFWWGKKKTPPPPPPQCCSLIGWMTGRECDGRSTINFPVVEKGRGVTALWSTIKRTRQIGRGAPVRGRARRAGPDKDGDGDAASHNSGRHKGPATARWHHSNTSSHTQPHWHAHKHQRWGFLHTTYIQQEAILEFLQPDLSFSFKEKLVFADTLMRPMFVLIWCKLQVLRHQANKFN